MQILKLNVVAQGIRWLMAALCEFLYQMIGWMFNLFMNITKVNILSSQEVAPIYQRVTMILTIIMIFYVTFEFVKYVVQPDNITDKEKGAGKVIYKMILVVALIAFVPTIFTYAYKFQSVIVDKGIIGKVIIGNVGTDPQQFGSTFSANLLGMFYKVDDSVVGKNEQCDSISCDMLVQMNLGMLANNGSTPYLTVGINETTKVTTQMNNEKVEVPKIYFAFHGFLPVIVGIFLIYILILYCIDIGTRWAQLVYLQIIAPIPIIGYLSPSKDGPFHKWVKQCITTYIDLFLRIAIIYFILLLCSILMTKKADMLVNVDPGLQTLVYVVLILGILLFAQKAPKLLGELFPSMGAASGNFGLKAGERVAPLAARTAGAALGGTLGFARRGIVSAVNRHRRNQENGQKSWFTNRAQRKENKQNQRQARDEHMAAQRAQDRKEKYGAQVNEQKKKVQEAAKAYNASKGTAQEATRKKELDTAAREYRDLMRKYNGLDSNALARRSKDSNWQKYQQQSQNASKIEAELRGMDKNDPNYANKQKELAEAKKSVQQAYNDYQNNSNYHIYKDKTAEEQRRTMIEEKMQSNNSQEAKNEAEDNLQKAQKKLTEAQENVNNNPDSPEAKRELENAKLNVKSAEYELEKAKEELGTSNENLDTAREKHKVISKGDTTTTYNNYETAQEKVAEDYNKRYGSVTGSFITGAMAGAAQGIWTGGHATNLKGVVTKTQEAWKNDTKAIRAQESFLDNGGASGMRGFVDKTVAKIQTGLGVDTQYERTISSTKPREQEIKELDAQISLSKDASGAADDADSIARKKSQDSTAKVEGRKIKTGLTTQVKNPITGEIENVPAYADVTGVNTVGELVRKYNAKAELAKNEADAATQNANNLRKESNEANMRLNDAQAKLTVAEAKGKDSKEYKEALQKFNEAKTEANIKGQLAAAAESEKTKLAEIAQEAQYEATNVEKNAARDEITQILQGNTANCHPAIIQTVAEGKEKLRSAALNPQLRDRVREELVKLAPGKATSLYNAFITQQITSFSDYDDISQALKNATSSASRVKTDLAETNRQIQTGSTAERYKAAQDAANGGK